MTDKKKQQALKIVTAAIIEEDGKYLIAQRPKGDPFEGLWEFPGGKVKAGEDPKSALQREIQEELGCEIDVTEPFDVVFYDYDDFSILMLAFNAHITAGEPLALECSKITFVTAEELRNYEFLPADISLIDRINQLKKGDSTSSGM